MTDKIKTMSKLEPLLPIMDAMHLTKLKIQQLKMNSYAHVAEQIHALEKEYLNLSDEFVEKAIEVEFINPIYPL